MSPVALRPVDADLDELFDQMRDPQKVWMAAFTAKDPNDRAVFDAHMARVRSAPDITLRAVTFDGQLVGSIASFVVEGATEITYWIARGAWGPRPGSRSQASGSSVPRRPSPRVATPTSRRPSFVWARRVSTSAALLRDLWPSPGGAGQAKA